MAYTDTITFRPYRTGLAGTLGYAIESVDGGTVLAARTTSGISEPGSAGGYVARPSFTESWGPVVCIHWTDAANGIDAIERFELRPPGTGYSAADRTRDAAAAAVIADATDSGIARRGDLKNLSAGIAPISTAFSAAADHYVDVVFQTRKAGGVAVAADSPAGQLRDGAGTALSNGVTVVAQDDAGVYRARVDTTALVAATTYTLHLTAVIDGASFARDVAITIHA